jgi:hypothetical protein
MEIDQSPVVRRDRAIRPFGANRYCIDNLSREIYIHTPNAPVRRDEQRTLEWPVISPVDVPVLRKKACANLHGAHEE